MIKYIILSLLIVVFIYHSSTAQVVINEFISSNTVGINDEDNEKSDWIELFNPSDQPVAIGGYKISDSQDKTNGWIFPDVTIPSDSFLILFASGKDKNGISPKFHTIIKKGDTWKYHVVSDNSATNWRNPDFDDSSWSSGPSGFGYGDDDDATVLDNAYIVLLRKEFTIDDVESLTSLLLHIDYDDGFVAFINGVEVAMGGIAAYNADYTEITTNSHEAVMYSGGTPEQFDLSASIPLLKNGKNVIAILGQNASASSSDFTLIPFLTISSKDFSTNDVESFIPIKVENLHTNFKLSKAGEPIYLYNADAVLIDSSKAVALDDDISYGRYPDGSDHWSYFDQPTPGKSNMNPIDTIVHDSIIFSQPAGFYTSPVILYLAGASLNPGEIRYTVDGSDPTENSSLYTMPLSLASTTVVRAGWFKGDSIPNRIFTHTYIFDQTNGLPVISISTNPNNLFDWNEGIFEMGPNAESGNPYFGANFWQDWEKPVHFEYFDQEKVEKIDQDAGIKIDGGWSRANDQKSVALFARKSYGKGSFKCKFFHDRENKSFKSILLRNSGNDWRYTMFRDGLISEIARDMDMERLAYQPSKIFINGKYWGILNLRDKISEHYIAEYYDVDEEEVNILENIGDVVYGKNDDYSKLKNFINSKSLSIDENYAQVSGMVDISCFTDYQILEIYVDNGDWPGNNTKYWKTNSPTSKWRWILYDTDFGFDLYSSNGNTMQFAAATNGSSWPNPPWSTLLLRKLLTNNEFKYNFINRFSDCMNSNLAAKNLSAKVDSIQNLLMPEIENHLERWGFSYDGWLSEVDRIQSFITTRKADMLSYLRSYFGFTVDHVITLTVSDEQAGKIKINTIVPVKYPFLGNYFGEVPITLKAMPNPGYRFVKWENGSSSTEMSIAVNLTSNTKFTAVFEAASSEVESVVINEINYKSPDDFDSGDWIELYNNGSQTVDLSGWILRDVDPGSGFVIPKGVILYPDEYLVVAGNLSKFKSTFPLVKNVSGEFLFGLNGSGDVVYLYDSGGNLIDKVNYGVQSPWPVDPCGLGPTLELKQPNLDNELAGNWSAGQKGGTPGERNSDFVSVEPLSLISMRASCFPTLFSDYTTLQFLAEKEGKYSVQIIDLQGKLIDKIDGYADKGRTISIDLFVNSEHFTSGVYLVKVQTGNSVQTVKVVKK